MNIGYIMLPERVIVQSLISLCMWPNPVSQPFCRFPLCLLQMLCLNVEMDIRGIAGYAPYAMDFHVPSGQDTGMEMDLYAISTPTMARLLDKTGKDSATERRYPAYVRL